MSKIIKIARSFVYYCCFFILTGFSILLGALHSLVAIFLFRKASGPVLRLNTWRYGALWTRLLGLFTPVTTEGCDQPLPSPCIIVMNHQSVFDPYCLGFLPASTGGCVNYWVTSWPFSIPVFGLCMRAVEYIDTTRFSGEDCVEQSKKLLAKGVNIAVFPEGTRSTTGMLGKFHIGVFKLAIETNIPVVPVCISGLGNFAPKGSLLIHMAPVFIKVLPPVTPGDYAHEGALPERALARAVREQIQKATVTP